MIGTSLAPRHSFSLGREVMPLMAGFLVVYLLGGSGYAAASAAIFMYALVWYTDSLGKEIAIVPAIALIASGQWLLAPAIYYSFESVAHDKYYMYVEEGRYYSYAFPAALAFISGLRLVFPVVSILYVRDFFRLHASISRRAGYAVFFLGLACGVLAPYVPSALAFFFFLGSQTIFISVIYFFVLGSSWRWLALLTVFGMQLANSAETGLFHDILLWSALTLSFVFSELRLRFAAKLVLIFVGLVLVAQLQAAKAHYRFLIAVDSSQAGIMTLAESMLQGSILDPEDGADIDWGSLNARFNQGWIVSAVMDYVPAQRNFENGSTIALAVRDALLPRILVNKRVVKVSDYFREYTGLPVNQNTSFGISVLGEAWVNFGHLGIIFMFFFGALYGVVFRAVLSIGRRYPSIVFWTPLLFLQALKSETEFVVVLNHLVKSGVFIVMAYYLLTKFLRVRI